MATKIITSRQLFGKAYQTIAQNWRLLTKVVAVYGVLDLFFVHGLSATVNLANVQTGSNQLAKGANVVSGLLGASGSGASQAASYYQSVLLVLVSLATIYVLNSLYVKKAKPLTSVKQAYYQSTGQLIPFVLALLLISVQLLPMLIGASIYSLVIGNGLAVGALENAVWLSLFLLLTLWSLYMVTASIFSLYIVFQPGTQPVAAWRSAKKLVAGRRWLVMRRLLVLPVVLIVAAAILILPFAIWLSPLAEWVFFAAGVVAVPLIHVYLFGLYQELK